MAVVCDGMGGMNGGRTASRIAAESLAKNLEEEIRKEDAAKFLREEAVRLDGIVYDLRDKDGLPMGAGTTIVTIVTRGEKLYWMSVGDSRIYMIREGKISILTREHNYLLSLNILKKRGLISEEEYMAESAKGEALISYIGMGNISLIDGNAEPIILKRGDIFVLCTDGLYRDMETEQISGIVRKYKSMQEAAAALTNYVSLQGKNNQDNASVVLLQYS